MGIFALPPDMEDDLDYYKHSDDCIFEDLPGGYGLFSDPAVQEVIRRHSDKVVAETKITASGSLAMFFANCEAPETSVSFRVEVATPKDRTQAVSTGYPPAGEDRDQGYPCTAHPANCMFLTQVVPSRPKISIMGEASYTLTGKACCLNTQAARRRCPLTPSTVNPSAPPTPVARRLSPHAPYPQTNASAPPTLQWIVLIICVIVAAVVVVPARRALRKWIRKRREAQADAQWRQQQQQQAAPPAASIAPLVAWRGYPVNSSLQAPALPTANAAKLVISACKKRRAG